MSLFNKIQDGDVTLNAFQSQLDNYRLKRMELKQMRRFIDRESFEEKLQELNLSIDFTRIFIDNFNNIKAGTCE